MSAIRYRCTWLDDAGRQCELEGTHRVVLVLQDQVPDLVKKILLEKERRCAGHQTKLANTFIKNEEWPLLAHAFARDALLAGRGERVPVRLLTTVHYVDAEGIDSEASILSIPVMAPRPDGKLEDVGKVRIIR